MEPQLVLFNGRMWTQDPQKPEVAALAITDGAISAIGDRGEILALAGTETRRVDLNNRCVIPGLNDSHLHVIRAGLFYNLELRWDGVPSIAQAMQQLKAQAENTPPPQWVRVVGGWNEWQFVEGRMPLARGALCFYDWGKVM
jgi:predicted amidohydrolase YtcJ